MNKLVAIPFGVLKEIHKTLSSLLALSPSCGLSLSHGAYLGLDQQGWKQRFEARRKWNQVR